MIQIHLIQRRELIGGDGRLRSIAISGDGSTVVAFNKNTGQEIWRALSAKEPGYAPPMIYEFGGRRQLIVWNPESVNGLDPETGKNLVCLTNQFALPALTICALYRCRWQVELFFKWIKQHLRIKRFYGTSENAVRTQIWIAISVYVLVAIIKKKLRLNVSLHTLLQILSLTLFEKLPLKQAVAGVEPIETNPAFHRQLNLFEF